MEEAYQEWFNKPPIQFLLRPSSPIKNEYSDSSSSHVGNGGNEVEVCMDDWLRQRSSMDAMFFHTFRNSEVRDDTCITESFFKRLKLENTTPLFEPRRSKST